MILENSLFGVIDKIGVIVYIFVHRSSQLEEYAKTL